MNRHQQREAGVSQPFQQRELNRTERRAAQERARLRREALAAAISESTPQTSFLPESPVEEEVRPRTKRLRTRQPRPGLRFAVGMVLVTLGAMAGLMLGGPVLGHDWDWVALGASAGVALAGSLLAWWNSLQVSSRTLLLSLMGAALVLSAFTLGVFNSVVINGTVYATTSDTAQAYRLSQEIQTDLEYIAQADQLLDAEQADARARYAEYTPTANRLAEISEHWSRVASNPDALPSPGFAAVATHTANGAHWAAEAMVRKQQLIVEPDARGEQDVNSYRATYAQEVLTAGPQLVEVAKLYGITLVEEGPVE